LISTGSVERDIDHEGILAKNCEPSTPLFKFVPPLQVCKSRVGGAQWNPPVTTVWWVPLRSTHPTDAASGGGYELKKCCTRQVKYLNNNVEQDHRFIFSEMGFFSNYFFAAEPRKPSWRETREHEVTVK